MNDLNLRVSGGVGGKVKKPVAPIAMPNWNTENPSSANKFIEEFLNSRSADEQLKFLKQYLNNNKDVCDQAIVEFLVSLFWGADAKHPVKGFLKKLVTDSRTLHEPFTERLIEVITDEIKDSASLPYGRFINVVARLDTCIDKFPPGAEAVSNLEIDVATYLLHCLESCVRTLSEGGGNVQSKADPLAPTEINKIYDLAHLSLRLLLYMIQKITDSNRSKLSSMFERIRAVTDELMRGKEVPMDTKSVSGIVALNLHLFENGPDSWIQLLDEEPSSSCTVNLCLYSAVATAVPRPLLAAAGARPALLELTDKVLDIGDRYSSDPSHSLAVARTVLAISKALPLAPPALAAPLAARLAGYCWPRLDHHMDSVRHLAAQAARAVMAATSDLDKGGDPSALNNILSALEAMGESRGAWAARAQLVATLGTRALALRPGLLSQAAAAAALSHQPHQASATLFLETLLSRYTQECGVETVCLEFVQGILDAVGAEKEPSALAVLGDLLARAVQWDSRVLDYILPDRNELHTYEGSDLKCILLVLGVVRKSGVANEWGTFKQLAHTAYDADDEIRILALSLVSSCPSTTEVMPGDELTFVMDWLRYNINAQAPAFRQLMLAHMKKILRHLEGSLVVSLTSQRSIAEAYFACGFNFYNQLRQLCFDSLVAGANYGRRACALQLLVWMRRAEPVLAYKPWTEERAELLYNVLEDTYENNKALALEVLSDCPTEFISKIQCPGDECLERLVRQAGRVKPTECVSASYKLLLLLRRGTVSLDGDTEGYPERPWFCLLRRLVSELVLQAARAANWQAAMFGVTHCISRAVGCVDVESIAGHSAWSQLIADVIDACAVVGARAEPVVSADSPEGLLPEPEDGDACLEEGRPVTAQMVLLIAWRSVKEISLLLGTLVSRLCLEGESAAWTLSAAQVEGVGGVLGGLLARVRHRGAFEQAYVGFTLLLARLWKCSSARLHQLPLQWYADIERDFLLPQPPEGAPEYCATRRGAGLPFMIQALVTTELATESSAPLGRLLSRCVSLCLDAARAPASAEAAARAHLVLRALFRHAHPTARDTAAAVAVAVRGFGADTWMERNSSTLLFAALTVRIFGVQRGKDARKLCARNRMTGRIFFLKYPELYDFLLEQLENASVDLDSLRPSLLPTLLLLGRLYPSALEGSVSNLKLERFLPLVVKLAGSRDVATRRLAARAAQPLLAPHRYIPHMQSLFQMLSDLQIKSNLCHGILCQLSVLLGAADALLDDGTWVPAAMAATRWLAGACCIIADEYLSVLRLLLLRFPKPGLLDDELTATAEVLERALFADTRPPGASGRELYLANAAHMYLIILTTCGQNIVPLTLRCLTHPDYEVQLSALNYILTLHGKCDDSNAFLDHLSQISKGDTLRHIQSDPDYMPTLGVVCKSIYAECSQKALQLLTLTPECPEKQHYIVRLKLATSEPLTYDRIVAELLDSAMKGPENLRHIYLESVVQLVSQYNLYTEKILPVLRTLYEHCSAGADECSRAAVVRFLEINYARFPSCLGGGNPQDREECHATVLAMAAILLEDDEPELRVRTAAAVSATHGAGWFGMPRSVTHHCAVAWGRAEGSGPAERRVLATLAARQLRNSVERIGPMLLVLAALDFRAAVRSAHQLPDESRVFDQNETHNVYLEEFTWTVYCAKQIKNCYKITQRIHSNQTTIDDYVASLVKEHEHIIEKLCIEDAIPCLTERKKSTNPKMDLFWKILDE